VAAPPRGHAPHSALPFSASTRRIHWRSLGDTTFDLLVIGGGVTGAGVARDAADRGLRVAVVDAGDWAQGTSSRSSRLIHGGLRYLQTRDFSLVFEASSERRRLLELAPHLVHPLPFLFPVYEDEGVGFRTLQAGMWLYDALALFRNIGRHQMLGRDEATEREPRLRQEGLRGAAVYYDAWVDDARLALATARAAHHAGAVTVSHAEVTGFRREREKLLGVKVRDRVSGEEIEVRAHVILNATGPWSDAVRLMANPAAVPRLRTTKGVHIVLRRERTGNRGAITFQSPVDGRVMFVLPWGQFTYVGTTDTDFTGAPGEAQADAADVDYLLASVNSLFPEADLHSDDVLSTWAGIRPLLAPADNENGVSAGQTSREHEIWRDDGGLLNIGGGKLTTFRVMAAEATDAAADILREEHGTETQPSRTGELPFPGAPEQEWDAFEAEFRECGLQAGLTSEAAVHLARRYGTHAAAVVNAIEADAALGAPLIAGLAPLWAEVTYAVENEMALTLEDMLQRRLNILYQAEDGGLGIAKQVAQHMALSWSLEWDEPAVAREVDAYSETVRNTRSFRSTV
jgi:glycerol-3-phosphate dehydrogenase